MTHSAHIQRAGKVVVTLPKGNSLSRFLRAMGVLVEGMPTREHVSMAHRKFRHARGESVEVNNLWNSIKRHICPVCDGVKLSARDASCSTVCAWNGRRKAVGV